MAAGTRVRVDRTPHGVAGPSLLRLKHRIDPIQEASCELALDVLPPVPDDDETTRGARVEGVPVHSLRLPGALAHSQLQLRG